MENESVKMDKLLGADNWSIWKFPIKMMTAGELEGINNGDLRKPELQRRVDESAEAAAARFEKESEAWKKLDARVQKIIGMSLRTKVIMHLISCTSGRAMWDKLCSVYDVISEVNIHLLQQKFYSAEKEPSEDIITFVSRLENINHKLTDCDEGMTEKMLITKILMSLPVEMRHFQSAWDSTNAEAKTLANLTARLSIEEIRNKTITVTSDALVTTRPPAKSSLADEGKKPGKCYNCGNAGHWRRDCRTLFERKKPEEQVKEAHEGEAFPVEAIMAETVMNEAVTLKPMDRKYFWFLDSGATDHMSSRREWFTDYSVKNAPIKVKIGDGSYIEAVGSGNIDVLS